MAFLNDVHIGPAASALLPNEPRVLTLGAVRLCLALIEPVCIVALCIACAIGYDIASFGRMVNTNRYLGLGLAAGMLFSAAAYARGMYSLDKFRQMRLQIRYAVETWILVLLCSAVIVIPFKANDQPSRATVLIFLSAGFAVIALLRWGVQRLCAQVVRSGGARPICQVAVVVQNGWSISASLAQAIADSGRSVCKAISLPLVSDWDELSECLSEVIDYVRQRSVDEILLAVNWADRALIEQILKHLLVIPHPVKLIPDQTLSALLEYPLLDIAGAKAIELRRAPLSPGQDVAKRLFDLVASALGLVVLLAPFAVVAALIVLDSRGPFFFRQRRVGFNGRLFHIYKFRTMRTLEDGSVIRQASQDDARVTRVGRVLRKFSIDELPQLLNVLKGEMSLVGPRPHALAHDNEYGRAIARYAARHNVRPGITGWAQVNGWRGATPQVEMMRARVAHDLWYIDHWSFWLDVKILLSTIARVAGAGNAY